MGNLTKYWTTYPEQYPDAIIKFLDMRLQLLGIGFENLFVMDRRVASGQT